MKTFKELREDTGKNGYIGFYKGKQYEIYASTSYEAQKLIAQKYGIKKPYEITIKLAEKDGKQVTTVAEEGNPNHASDGKFSSGGGSGAKSSDSSKSPKESEHKFKDSDSKKTISISGSDPETALKNHFSKKDSVDFVKVEKNGKNYTARVFYKTHGEPKDGWPISGPVDTYKFKLGK